MKTTNMVMVLAAALLAACEIGEVVVTTSDGDDHGESSSVGDVTGEDSTGMGTTSTGDQSSIGIDESGGSTQGNEQCDIVIDQPLPVLNGLVYSECYTAEVWPCTTCALWCETAGFSECSHVEHDIVCSPPGSGASVLACHTNIMESAVAGAFRCACDIA